MYYIILKIVIFAYYANLYEFRFIVNWQIYLTTEMARGFSSILQKMWILTWRVSECEELVGEVNHTTECVTDLYKNYFSDFINREV